MASIQCPHCRHEASVPSLEPLLGKNVKCPSCNQSFTVSSDSSPAIQTGAPAAMAAPRAYAPSRRRTRNRFWFLPLEYDPAAKTSAGRYPNLIRYLYIADLIYKIQFWIGVAAGVFFFFAGLYGGFQSIPETIESDFGDFTRGSWLEAIGFPLLITFVFLPIYYILLWLGYIAAVAVTEMIRVFIDVENNTRQ